MNDDTNNQKQQKEEITQEQLDTILDEQEFDETEKLIKEIESKYKRALADYQNLEKRVREERVQWIQTASKDLLVRMLPIIDTLLLAQKHSDDKTLSVVTQQFLDLLKSEGVTKIETKDKKFDPKLMECIEVIEGEDGKVLEELRVGFLLHDKVLRVAGVKVGKKL